MVEILPDMGISFFFGGGVQPIEKHWESHLQCTQEKEDHSIASKQRAAKGIIHVTLVVEARPRAATSVCVERQLLVDNNSEITNRLGCPQYAARKVEIFVTLADHRQLLFGAEPDYV